MKQDPELPPTEDPDEALWVSILSGDRSTDDPEIRSRAESDPAFARRLATFQALGSTFDRVSESERELFREADGHSRPAPRPQLVTEPVRRVPIAAWSGWLAAAGLLLWMKPWQSPDTARQDPSVTIERYRETTLAGSEFPLRFTPDEQGGGTISWSDLESPPGTSFHVRVLQRFADGDRELFRTEVEDVDFTWETLPWSPESKGIVIEVEQELEFVVGQSKQAALPLD